MVRLFEAIKTQKTAWLYVDRGFFYRFFYEAPKIRKNAKWPIEAIYCGPHDW